MNYISKPQFLVLLILCFYGLSSVNSQDVEKYSGVLNLKRNAIYGSIGMGIMNVSASMYYERIIGVGIDVLRAETFIRAGKIGVAGFDNGECLSLDAGLLIGEGRYSMAELTVGWHPNLGEVSDLIPIGGSVAVRYQKPQGNFIFRFGVGYPEALFASLGFCF